jgi:RNA polymerase sigma-70 factor (ECF subfamily)
MNDRKDWKDTPLPSSDRPGGDERLSHFRLRQPLNESDMARGEPALRIVPLTEAAEVVGVPSYDLDALFRRYAPYVAAVAHRLLGRDEEVDDTVQEVFLAAVRGVHAVRDPAAIRGWLARIAVRAARERLRKRRMRSFFGLDDPVAYESVVDAGASSEQRALVARVYRLLDGIPADQRIAWALRYIEGEPLESVAVLCGCSLATAKRRIAAAAKRLNEAFSDD